LVKEACSEKDMKGMNKFLESTVKEKVSEDEYKILTETISNKILTEGFVPSEDGEKGPDKVPQDVNPANTAPTGKTGNEPTEFDSPMDLNMSTETDLEMTKAKDEDYEEENTPLGVPEIGKQVKKISESVESMVGRINSLEETVKKLEEAFIPKEDGESGPEVVKIANTIVSEIQIKNSEDFLKMLERIIGEEKLAELKEEEGTEFSKLMDYITKMTGIADEEAPKEEPEEEAMEDDDSLEEMVKNAKGDDEKIRSLIDHVNENVLKDCGVESDKFKEVKNLISTELGIEIVAEENVDEFDELVESMDSTLDECVDEMKANEVFKSLTKDLFESDKEKLAEASVCLEYETDDELKEKLEILIKETVETEEVKEEVVIDEGLKLLIELGMASVEMVEQYEKQCKSVNNK